MKSEKQSFFYNKQKNLTIGYIAALSLIALLTTSAYFLIQRQISTQETDAKVINLSGRQRMLSQQLTKEILLLVQSPNIELKKIHLQKLKDITETWSKVHNGLKNGDKEFKLPGNNSPEVLNYFKKIEPPYQIIKNAVNKVLKLDFNSLVQLTFTTAPVHDIVDSSPLFLEWMDKIVFQFQKEADNKLTVLRRYERNILAVVLLILFLEALLIFRPMIHGIAKSYESLLQAEEQLRQAQKMEAIGTLAGGIAHDFNNILHCIIGFANLLKKRLPEDKKQHFIGNIKIAAMRGGNLTKRLLTFSRKHKSEKTPTDIRDVVKESLEILRPSIPSIIKIETYINPDDSCIVLADASQIHQVVMNICVNAAQAMPDGGMMKIDLRAQNKSGEMCEKSSHCKITCPYIRLIISDTGSGIKESIHSQIFDPFFTTKPTGQGTGLGLSVVHGIIKSHGGNITFSSEPGKGTTFCVCFPMLNETDLAGTSYFQTKLPLIRKRILFVDDEALIVMMTTASLTDIGHKVTSFTSSVKALEVFKKTPDLFDIVITDLTMPDLTGLGLTKKIKKIRKEIPVLLCTGYGHKVSAEASKKAGVSELLKKPIDIDDLASAIERALDKTSHYAFGVDREK